MHRNDLIEVRPVVMVPVNERGESNENWRPSNLARIHFVIVKAYRLAHKFGANSFYDQSMS